MNGNNGNSRKNAQPQGGPVLEVSPEAALGILQTHHNVIQQEQAQACAIAQPQQQPQLLTTNEADPARVDLLALKSYLNTSDQTCGVVAAQVWMKFGGGKLHELDNRRNRGGVMTKKDIMGAIERPKGAVYRVVGFNFASVDHQMTVVISPNGIVHTLQAFYPLIRRPFYFNLTYDEFYNAMCKLTGTRTRTIDNALNSFDALTHVSWAQRVMSEPGTTGFKVDPKRIANAEQIGKFWLQARAEYIGKGTLFHSAVFKNVTYDDENEKWDYA